MPFKDPNRKREYQRSYQRAWHRERKAAFLKGKVCERCGSADRLEIADREGRSLRKSSGINPWSLSRKRWEELVPRIIVLCASCARVAYAPLRRDTRHPGPTPGITSIGAWVVRRRAQLVGSGPSSPDLKEE